MESLIVPIFKNGDKRNYSNTRTILITPCIAILYALHALILVLINYLNSYYNYHSYLYRERKTKRYSIFLSPIATTLLIILSPIISP